MWESIKDGSLWVAAAISAVWMWTADEVKEHPNIALASFLAILIISFWF